MKRIALVAALALLAAGGCRHKVGSEKTYEVDRDKLIVGDLPAAKTLAVEFASKDNVPVTATLVRKEDADTVLDAVNKGKSPQEAVASVKALATRERAASGTLNAPKSDKAVEYSVLLTSDKPATVTVKTKGE